MDAEKRKGQPELPFSSVVRAAIIFVQSSGS